MTVEVINRTVFVGNGAKALRIVGNASRPWMQGSLRLIRDEWRKGVRVDTGTTKKSIGYRTRQTASSLTGEVSSSKPELVKLDEDGKKAGGKMAPPGTFLRSGWLGRHGMEETARMDFLVNRAQARTGRPGTHAAAKAVRRFGGLLTTRTATLERLIAGGLNRGA